MTSSPTPYARVLMLAGLTAICSHCGGSPETPGSSTGGSPTPDGSGGAIGGTAGGTTGGAPAGGNPTGGVSSGTGGSSSTGGAMGGTPPGAGGAPMGGLPGSGGTTGGGPTLGGMMPVTGGTSTGGESSSGGSAPGGAGTGGGVSGSGGQALGGVETAGGTLPASGGAATGGEPTSGGSAAGGISGTGGNHSGTPSSGCSVTDVATGTAIDSTMTVPGQSTPREYRLSVPADYVPGEPLPVVFVLNGVGGTGPQAQQFFQVETGHRAIFVYPTSLPNDEAGGSIAWDFSLNGVDVPFFDALVSYLEGNYCVDMSRIFVLGASSGGIMSNMLGCFRGDVIRAIAPSSGMTWQQSGCVGDVAVMVICGEQDSFNACDDGQNGALSETNVWVPLNGCTQPTQTTPSPIAEICQEFQGCRADTPLLLCAHAGGHGWPTSDGDFWWQFFMSLD